MSTLRRTAIGAAVIAGLAWSGVMAGASPAEPAKTDDNTDDNQCVFFQTLYDWRALDSTNMVLWAPNRKDAYHVTLSFPITDLRTQESLVFVDGNHDGRLCGFGMDQIVATRSSFPERSTIRGMTRLDEAGLVSLGEQYHVKLVRKPQG